MFLDGLWERAVVGKKIELPFLSVIDFFITHVHPKFVYKLSIDNQSTTLNMNIY